MAKKSLMVVFALLAIAAILTESKRSGRRGDNKKRTRVNRIGRKLSKNTVTEEFEFPEELELDFAITGEATMKTKSRRVSSLRDMPTFDSRGRKHTRNRKNQQFYVDDNGSYQVSAIPGADGKAETDVKATYRNGKGEKCFYARGESHCWNIQGKGEFKSVPFEGSLYDKVNDKATSTDRRKKRQDGPLVYTDFEVSRVFKVVYVADQAMMDWFRSLSNDDETAIQDAEDYIMMINNELTYMYRGIKEVSEADTSIPDMDIVVYAQGFYYPEFGTEIEWVAPLIRSNGILAFNSRGSDGLDNFGLWVQQGNLNQFGDFDHATFLTPRGLVDNGGNRFLGIAFLQSVCNPFLPQRQVSMNEDADYDVVLTAAHELGHALDADHDGDRRGNGAACVNRRHIMSASAFSISSTTQDTWNRWSTCSVSAIVSHVRRFSGCLLNSGVSNDNFYDQLCRGVRGSNQFDVNFQCKTAFKVESSVACAPSATVSSGKVPAQACWDDFIVSCTNSQNQCSSSIVTIFDGTPCIGEDENTEYVCHRGDCLQKVDVCAGRNGTTGQPTNAPTTNDPGTPVGPTTMAPQTDAPTTVTSVTTTAPTTPPSCDCTTQTSRRRRRRCCRRFRNVFDQSCCMGCRRNRRGGCRPT